jgi:hypothetical protein
VGAVAIAVDEVVFTAEVYQGCCTYEWLVRW